MGKGWSRATVGVGEWEGGPTGGSLIRGGVRGSSRRDRHHRGPGGEPLRFGGHSHPQPAPPARRRGGVGADPGCPGRGDRGRRRLHPGRGRVARRGRPSGQGDQERGRHRPDPGPQPGCRAGQRRLRRLSRRRRHLAPRQAEPLSRDPRRRRWGWRGRPPHRLRCPPGEREEIRCPCRHRSAHPLRVAADAAPRWRRRRRPPRQGGRVRRVTRRRPGRGLHHRTGP